MSQSYPPDPFVILTQAKTEHEQASQLDGFVRRESGVHYAISEFGKVGAINVLVGPNNSGKSRILRQLFSKPFAAVESDRDTITFLHRLSFDETIDWSTDGHSPWMRGGVRAQLKTFLQAPGAALQSNTGDLLRQHGIEFPPLPPTLPFLTSPSERELHLWMSQNKLSLPVRWSSEIPRVFIPCLRTTLRVGDSAADQPKVDSALDADGDLLQRTFVDAYGLGRGRYDWRPSNLCVFTGALLYELVRHFQGSAEAESARLDELFAFLGAEFFEERAVKLVPRNVTERRHDVTGNVTPQVLLELRVDNDEARPLQELGDGVSALLTLVAPLFLQPPGSWIFVEEPENHLHPGLQRQYVDILSREGVDKRGHRFFITTHSNHILEALQVRTGVRVFCVNRAKHGKVWQHVVEETPASDLRLLDSLGVSAASVIQARCIIWVEGPTDIKYVRGLLRLALGVGGGTLLEGRDFAFIAYGGSLLTDIERDPHPSALHAALPRILSVAARSMVIADRDGTKKAKAHEERVTAYAKAGVPYLITKGREIENELGVEVWKQILRQAFPKEELADAPADASRLIERDPIGKFVDEWRGTQRRAGSGTLCGDDKGAAATAFQELVSADRLTWDQLSPSGRLLATEVAKFIRESDRLSRPV